MIRFARAQTAAPARSRYAALIAVAYAAVLTLFVVAQLFHFETFPSVLSELGLPVQEAFVFVLAPLIVVAELFAIPFLLRMKVSHGFRWFSMLLGWLVAVLWMSLSVWAVVNQSSNVGFLGATIALEPGWWAVSFSGVLAVMAAWSSWGLWPSTRRTTS